MNETMMSSSPSVAESESVIANRELAYSTVCIALGQRRPDGIELVNYDAIWQTWHIKGVQQDFDA